MQDPDDIHAALAAFDGTDVAPLKAVARDGLTPDALATLIAAIPGPDEVATTWLLKALVERGQIGAGALADVFDRLPQITAPDAALHILQCAQYAPDAAPVLRPHLAPFHGSKKIFLRVWAFDAYCRAADPAEDLSERILQGLTDRSAAMRARSRALARDFGIDLGQA
ncbi:hypothetical protein KUL25_14160 [Rhodobacteraceae bacterium N5(2021)]|uniref:Uncharacterized protein n=1 Tax=Gymnodinialimonas phycosphaerae TaxID=2841589 RepID=A0A975TSC5_9RHOB|nr:hypothetical protein [Gymnodinialimonas phycosphaerae]MBY4893899.1 hypothetical protein [Gymnodinialimonas phycosphaerae]